MRDTPWQPDEVMGADHALYELKTAASFAAEHDAQLLNYMFLLGISRAKLLNFRPTIVQGKTIATSLTYEERQSIRDACERWTELTPACATLRRTMRSLLDDWGAFLEVIVYEEALVHFFGGASSVERRINLHRDGLALGQQRMLLHAPGIAFRITAFTSGQNHIESNLRRLLSLTDLEALQWINLNHAEIEFTTITKGSSSMTARE